MQSQAFFTSASLTVAVAKNSERSLKLEETQKMSQSLDPNTILVVDDTPNNLKVLSKTLTTAGYTVAVAKNGESALKQIEYKPPALILLDVQMPGMDGFETCKRLKENPATCDIPVIFMTALSETEGKVKGLSLGAVDYITKPFQAEEVLARISVHIKLRTLTKQLQEQNQLLEQRVAERTIELTCSLKNQQETQLQLVQNEKMSTLGQLVAGVAHEINNPVGCIAGNLSHIETYIKDVFDLLSLYQKHCTKSVPEIVEKIEAIDLEFIKEDIPKLISSMAVATDRIVNLSTSLRTFYRTDSSSTTLFNIHELIDSTLMILKHRLKANQNRPEIEVITEYGAIPEVECYPGQLSQVFVNLIANAIDALEEGDGNRQSYMSDRSSPKIWIRTELGHGSSVMGHGKTDLLPMTDDALFMAQFVTISIKDNGSGMPEEVKEKVFDYLFTTKPVGKGTGLGLSISRQIIEENHGGSIQCISSLGQGTEFIIQIPLS